MKTKLLVIICIIISSIYLSACNKEKIVPDISFMTPPTMEELNSYSGKIIKVRGFMATVSPIDGSYLYILSLPFQSCPYCAITDTGITNTLTVFPKKGSTFSYTALPIEVTGTLVFEENIDSNGYVTQYHIKDAIYTIYKDEKNKKITEFTELLSNGYTDQFSNAMTEIYVSVNMVSGEPVMLPETLFDSLIESTRNYKEANQLAERGRELVNKINEVIRYKEYDELIELNKVGQELYNDFYLWLMSMEL